MSARLLLLLSLAVLFTPGCSDTAEPSPHAPPPAPVPITEPEPLPAPEPVPGLISDKWYAEFFDDKQSAWLNAVWTESEFEGKPSVHDHTEIESRSVRAMSGMEDKFVARTVIDLERGANGDLYWIRVVRTEGDPEAGGQVTVSEQRFTGDGYELVMTNGDLEEKHRVACDAPVPADTEAFLCDKIRRGEIATGRKLEYPSPDFLTGKMVTVHLEVIGTETLSLSTGPCLCFKVRETFEGRPGESLLWLDAEGTFRQARTGRTVLVSTTKNRAQDISEGGHVYSIVVHATPSIPRITSSDRSVIEVELEERVFGEAPDFPDSPFSREIERRGNVHVLELTAHDDPAATVALPVVDPDLEKWLESTNLLCASAPTVQAAMREAIGDETDGREVAKLLLHYVFSVLLKASGPVLSPNAAQILTDGGGDCSEHAVLFVALCRAAGLPARLVSGYAQVGNHWGSHAFTEVWLGKWIGADPTTNELGTKARYICFGWPGMDGSYPGLISDQVQERLTIRTLEFTDEGETVDLRKPLPQEERRDLLSGLHFAEPPDGWEAEVFHGYASGHILSPSLICNLSVDHGMGDLPADILHSRLLPFGEQMTFAGIPCAGYRIGWETQTSIQLLIPVKRRTLSLDINLLEEMDEEAEAKAMATLAEILAPVFLRPAKMPPDTLSALVRALEDPDRGVRFAAANALGKAGADAAEAGSCGAAPGCTTSRRSGPSPRSRRRTVGGQRRPRYNRSPSSIRAMSRVGTRPKTLTTLRLSTDRI